MEETPKPSQLTCEFCAQGGTPDLRRVMRCRVRDENPFEAACARSPELSRGAGPYLRMVDGSRGQDDVAGGVARHSDGNSRGEQDWSER